ncbi:MAG: adenosine deaminase [Candidatus Hydrogenedentota bacterium]|nr:MAG: adenosine deaminase [Candidatus Hydrogenedentota bacterium]
MIPVTEDLVRRIPKVLLHEHLDGGLRPNTILELAEQLGVDLPESDPERLATWFHRGADRGSLPLYLEGFGTTIAIMQTADALERIAYEAILDAAAENIVYIELRFHPGYHTQRGLSLEGVMNAVLSGLDRGSRETGVEYGLIVCAMRNMDPSVSLEMAELAVNYRNKGVVGFDLAGEEAGHPPKKHVEAFHYVQRANGNITIHAGEAFGKESIWQALQWCGAHRIGHATHLLEDMVLDENGKLVSMGTLAQYVLDKRIPLEICLLSNIHTGAAESLATHPFPLYWRYRFRVTLNTDNRLMSNTTMTKEMWTAAREYNLDLDDLEKITINAMKSAFIPHKRRLKLIYETIKTGYQKLRLELA